MRLANAERDNQFGAGLSSVCLKTGLSIQGDASTQLSGRLGAITGPDKPNVLVSLSRSDDHQTIRAEGGVTWISSQQTPASDFSPLFSSWAWCEAVCLSRTE
jgi:hypothetical protein